jgi:hypothetical protein
VSWFLGSAQRLSSTPIFGALFVLFGLIKRRKKCR